MKDLFYMPSVEEYSDGSKMLGMFIGDNPKAASGAILLMQIWISTLLSEIGHAVLDYDSGGGIQELIGKNATSIAGKDLRNIITIAVQKTNEEVIRNQIEEGITDNNELLDQAYVVNITTDGASSADITIRLLNKAGKLTSNVIPFSF